MSTDNIPKPNTGSPTVKERFLNLLINNIKDHAIFMLDPNGYILSWNKGAENIKGYYSDEIIGQHMSIFYTPDDRSSNEPRHNLNEALRKNFHESEGWRVRKDGSIFWANVVFTTLYDDDGHLIGFAKITRDLSERKKKEDQKIEDNNELERRVTAKAKSLIARERHFRKLIENSYDGISLFDKNLQVFYRSRSAERINGWNNVERSVQTLEELIHPDDLAKVKRLFNDVLAQRDRTLIGVYRTLHKDGHYIWVECQLNNRLADKDIEAIVCNFRDVTERIKATEQIKDKNRQIENILESITDGFIGLDKNLCYTYANKKLGEMVGCAPAALIGKQIWDKFPDAVNSATYQAFHQAVHEQRYITNEDYYAPLGLWQENHIYPSANGLSVFIRDITERKLAEASLLQSESNLRSVFENTDLAIVLFDMEATILSFNNNARKLAGQHFGKELRTGLSAFNYCSLERRPYVKKILQAIRETSHISYEISYPLPAQEVVWFEVKWVSVVDQATEPIGVILTLKDITEKKRAELERDRITADLLQRNKDLEQFTYIISHNLRAPVANIQGLSELLGMMSCANDSENAEALQALTRSVCGLDKIILDLNNILQVSTAVNDTLELVSFWQVMDEVKAVSGSLIEKNGAMIQCDFNQVDELMSLKSYLYSIFQNLIINSIKYRKSNVPPVITIKSELTANSACITFNDNGKGIDLERYSQQLFGLYKRFDQSVEGKGMGLFMVKTQVERLGGQITVQSRLNEGTTFKLEFPLKLQGA